MGFQATSQISFLAIPSFDTWNDCSVNIDEGSVSMRLPFKALISLSMWFLLDRTAFFPVHAYLEDSPICPSNPVEVLPSLWSLLWLHYLPWLNYFYTTYIHLFFWLQVSHWRQNLNVSFSFFCTNLVSSQKQSPYLCIFSLALFKMMLGIPKSFLWMHIKSS